VKRKRKSRERERNFSLYSSFFCFEIFFFNFLIFFGLDFDFLGVERGGLRELGFPTMNVMRRLKSIASGRTSISSDPVSNISFSCV
jgi:hypothetical protein